MASNEFRRGLEKLINIHSRENGSNTPDHILADYIAANLAAFDEAVRAREKWYGREFVGGRFTDAQTELPLSVVPNDESDLPAHARRK